MNDIGTEIQDALYCLSPSNASSVNTEWYLPDGRPLSSTSPSFIDNIFIQESSAITLYDDDTDAIFYNNIHILSSIKAPNGVLRCETPDASGMTQSIYTGIYNERDG